MHARSARACLILLFLVGLTFASTIAASFVVPLASRDDFNVVAWELRNIPNKWLYLSGAALRGHPSREEEDARIASFLDLSARIDRLEGRAAGDPLAAEERATLVDRRDEIENLVEAAIEGRLTATLEELGLESSMPLFPHARWVFPPVDVEFDDPPNELAISRRDRIELLEQRALRQDLTLQDVIAIETEREQSGEESAHIAPLAGAATYPSLVRPPTTYQEMVEIVAHEWVHQYLFFHPLGRGIEAGSRLRVLNEAVATIAGAELSRFFLLQHPLAPPYDRLAVPQESTVDVDAALTALRTDVDALLAFGQVDAAEALMETRRRALAEQGVLFRRINQAFFAFRNTYATEAGSTDPLGDKVLALRARSETIASFLREAAALDSEAGLDRLLSAPSAGDTGR